MKRATTSTFITEVELRPSATEAKKLRTKFQIARMVWNAALGEALRRLRKVRDSVEYQQAREITKQIKELEKGDSESKGLIPSLKLQANALFRSGDTRIGFGEFALKDWARDLRYLDEGHKQRSFIGDHLGALTVEQTAKMVWDVVNQYRFGKRGRPRFRRKHELLAVEGRTESCCRWKGNGIAWGTLSVSAIINEADEVQKHGLSMPIKYVRMVRKVIRGKERYIAQLCCTGEPYRKESHRPNMGVVGVDLGPSTIAVSGEQGAFLRPICGELERKDRQIRRLARALDRSKRSTNLQNFTENGQIRRGVKLEWNWSRRYVTLRERLANLQRKQADQRKQIHSRLAVDILKLGDDVRFEDLNYTAWQKRRRQKKTGHRKKGFGKSVGFHAPSALIQRLKTEAAKWGVSVTEIDAWKTKLSQTCLCGNQQKKSLSQRVHECPSCQTKAQRDLFSAYLARFVESGHKLQVKAARASWPENCSLLEGAWSVSNVTNRRKAFPGAETGERVAILNESTDEEVQCPSVQKTETERTSERPTTSFLPHDSHPTSDTPSNSNGTGGNSG